MFEQLKQWFRNLKLWYYNYRLRRKVKSLPDYDILDNGVYFHSGKYISFEEMSDSLRRWCESGEYPRIEDIYHEKYGKSLEDDGDKPW